MTAAREEFKAIEIDALDDRLTETAKRKRIPSLTLDQPAPPRLAEQNRAIADGRGGFTDGLSGPEPTHRPPSDPQSQTASSHGHDRDAAELAQVRQAVRRRPLSLEVPEYLARELKVKAATEAVTVRFLVLSALSEAGYRVDSDELEEDGRRLR